MALEIIDGSIYKPTKEVVLYKHLNRAAGVYDPGPDDITINENNAVMYYGIE